MQINYCNLKNINYFCHSVPLKTQSVLIPCILCASKHPKSIDTTMPLHIHEIVKLSLMTVYEIRVQALNEYKAEIQHCDGKNTSALNFL